MQDVSLILDRQSASGSPETQARLHRDAALFDDYSRTVVAAVDRVAPAVVNIAVQQKNDQGGGREIGGNGSGFLIAPDGFSSFSDTWKNSGGVANGMYISVAGQPNSKLPP